MYRWQFFYRHTSNRTYFNLQYSVTQYLHKTVHGVQHHFLLFPPPFPPAPICVYKSPCHVLFDLPLMKALDWAETFGNFVTIDICPSIYLASEVLNPQSCLHLATQRVSKRSYSICYKSVDLDEFSRGLHVIHWWPSRWRLGIVG